MKLLKKWYEILVEFLCTFKVADNERLSLTNNFLWSFIGNSFFYLMQWGVLIVITKTLDVSSVGLYTLAISIVSPVLLFSDLKLRTVQVTDSNLSYDANNYISLRILTIIISFLLILSLSLIFHLKNDFLIIVFVVFISKSLDSFSDILFGDFQRRRRLDVMGKSKILKSIFSLTMFSLTILMTKELFVSLFAIIIVNIIFLIAYDLRLTKRNFKINISIKSKTLYKIVMIALPLGIVQGLASLNINIPKYYLNIFYGNEEVAHFSTLVYFIFIINLIVNSLAQATLPYLTDRINNNDINEFLRLLYKLFALTTTIIIVFLIFVFFLGEPIISLVYTEEYTKYSNILYILILGSLFQFNGAFIDNAISSTRNFKVQMYILIIVTAVGLLLGMYFVRKYGVLGAALSYASIMLFMFGLKLIALDKIIKRKKVEI